MSKHQPKPKERKPFIFGTGFTKAEINARTDRLRKEMLDYVLAHGETPLRVYSRHVGLTHDSIRNYANYLIRIGCMTKRKDGLDTFYTATGKPYESVRKSTVKEDDPAIVTGNPHARVIRLLDRAPKDVSKQEHQQHRRTNSRSAFTSSSMGLFDTF